MGKHYICTGGCRGESETPGVCQTEECPKHGQPLTECDCTDGHHARILSASLPSTPHDDSDSG